MSKDARGYTRDTATHKLLYAQIDTQTTSSSAPPWPGHCVNALARCIRRLAAGRGSGTGAAPVQTMHEIQARLQSNPPPWHCEGPGSCASNHTVATVPVLLHMGHRMSHSRQRASRTNRVGAKPPCRYSHLRLLRHTVLQRLDGHKTFGFLSPIVHY